VENDLESAKEAFCNDLRSRPKSSWWDISVNR
jgi:hypothetical protein